MRSVTNPAAALGVSGHAGKRDVLLTRRRYSNCRDDSKPSRSYTCTALRPEWTVTEESSNERYVRVLVRGPLRDVRCEGVNGLPCWFLIQGVSPQQLGQVCDVIRAGLTNSPAQVCHLVGQKHGSREHNCVQPHDDRICRTASAEAQLSRTS